MKPELCALAVSAIVVQSALAQVSSVRSSILSEAEIYLTNTTESDDQTTSDEQFLTIDPLGPITSLVAINSAQGSFSASSSCSASFMSTEQFSFQANQQFEGTRGPGKIDAQSYGQTLQDEFQYDFSIPAEGQL
ncbi:MAG: hypothetical protein JJ974_05485, partial [Phycisphaerales bacterium]|nr:hypothetical protein [Phycisphaerales bacterium]